jgi:hypothetical protein
MADAAKQKFMVKILPWAAMGLPVKIGPVTFWDYRANATKLVKRKDLRAKLRKLFRCYVTNTDQRQTRSLAMASHGDTDLRVLGMPEQEDIRDACDAYVFSVLYPNMLNAIKNWRGDGGPPSSDRYAMKTHTFTLESNHCSLQAGTRMDIRMLKELKFVEPFCLGGFSSRPSDIMIEGFNALFQKGFNPNVRRRVLRALEWFRMAHSEVDELHPLVKVVMMATAFEILCSVGGKQMKAATIREFVEKRMAGPDSETEERELTESTPGKPDRRYKVRRCKAAWWAADFYSLRNKVTHGDQVDPRKLGFDVPNSKKKWSQLDLADMVFGELIVWELEENKCFGDHVEKYVAEIRKIQGKSPNEPVEATLWQHVVRTKHRLFDPQRVFGWWKEDEFAKRARLKFNKLEDDD